MDFFVLFLFQFRCCCCYFSFVASSLILLIVDKQQQRFRFTLLRSFVRFFDLSLVKRTIYSEFLFYCTTTDSQLFKYDIEGFFIIIIISSSSSIYIYRHCRNIFFNEILRYYVRTKIDINCWEVLCIESRFIITMISCTDLEGQDKEEKKNKCCRFLFVYNIYSFGCFKPFVNCGLKKKNLLLLYEELIFYIYFC